MFDRVEEEVRRRQQRHGEHLSVHLRFALDTDAKEALCVLANKANQTSARKQDSSIQRAEETNHEHDRFALTVQRSTNPNALKQITRT